MAVDEKFLKAFEQETDLLRKLHAELENAIQRADQKIDRMRKGESKEDIFGAVPPKE